MNASALVLGSSLIVAANVSSWLDHQAPDHELITLSDGLSDSTVFSRLYAGTQDGENRVVRSRVRTDG